MRIWDISEPIEPRTAVFPGDTPFSAQWIMHLDRGDSCTVSAVTMSPHCGSHADAPSHFVAGGADIARVPLEPYVGPCRLADVRGEGAPPFIALESLEAALHGRVERLLLRTNRSHDHRRFDPGFTALGPAAARRLAAAGLRLVGIDTPSMDTAAAKDLATHRILAEAGIALLENLDLSAPPAGDYELIALPLRIAGGDSSPVRAILRELR
jgi:arylformamidase